MTLANRNICDQMQNLKLVFPPYQRTGDSAGEKYKMGFTLGSRSFKNFFLVCFSCFIFEGFAYELLKILDPDLRTLFR